MNVFTPCEGALLLMNLLEMHLQKGSVLCMSLSVSFLYAMRVGGAFTLSLVDVGVVSVGVVLAVLFVLLWVWVAGPSGVDVTNILIKVVGVAGVSLTSTNHERQSAALLWAPDIHSNGMLQVASSRDHQFTLVLEFLPLRYLCKGPRSLQMKMSDPFR